MLFNFASNYFDNVTLDEKDKMWHKLVLQRKVAKRQAR